MYSSTISTQSTATVAPASCEIENDLRSNASVPAPRTNIHTLDDRMPVKLCRSYLERGFPGRHSIPKQLIDTKCVTCEKAIAELDKTIDEWAAKQFDNKCYPIEVTRRNFLRQKERIEKISSDLQKSVSPWFIPTANDEPVVPMYKRYYNYPKMAVQLPLGFDDQRKIIEYTRHGFNLFIINIQHGTRSTHQRTFKCIDQAIRNIEQNPFMDYEIGVVAEITDPKLTTGLLKHGVDGVYLDRDSRVLLTADRRFSHKGTQEVIYVNFMNFINGIHRKDIIKIGSEIQVEVVERLLKTLVCKVTGAGLLKSRTEVILPDTCNLLGKGISTEEEEDIKFVLENDISDYIICPCAHSINVCQHIGWFMATHQKRLFIIGRLKPEQYHDEDIVNKIVQEFSAVWIDNSGLEAPTEVEKMVISKCIVEGKPLLRSAKYICNSHIKLPVDKAACRNLLLYPDCLVIPACLPNGFDPCEIQFSLRRSYPEMNDETLEYTCTFLPREYSAPHMLIRQVALNVIFEKVSCVVMVSNTGRSVILLSQNRINVPIVATVRDETISRRLLIWKNVIPLLYYDSVISDWGEELDARVAFSVNYAKKFGYITKKDVFLLCFDSHRGMKFADTYRLCMLNCEEDSNNRLSKI